MNTQTPAQSGPQGQGPRQQPPEYQDQDQDETQSFTAGPTNPPGDDQNAIEEDEDAAGDVKSDRQDGRRIPAGNR